MAVALLHKQSLLDVCKWDDPILWLSQVGSVQPGAWDVPRWYFTSPANNQSSPSLLRLVHMHWTERVPRNRLVSLKYTLILNYAHTIILILLLILILVLLLILILVLLLRLTTCTCTCTYTYAYALVYLPYIWVSILSLTRPWLWVCPTPHKVGAAGGGGIVLIYLFTSSSPYYYYYYYYIGTSTN